MIEIDIPGWKTLRLQHLICDYNGTLSLDGVLIGGVAPLLTTLAQQLQVHVLTGDGLGTARAQLAGLPCHVEITPPEQQALTKLNYVHRLGADGIAAIGNGRNDRLMLEAAALGIAVIGGEGASSATVAAGDVVAAGIVDALELLLNPSRLRATLRA